MVKKIFPFVTDNNYIFLYEGASYSVDYNVSIVVRFAHNIENVFSNPDSIRYWFSMRIGTYDSPPFQYVIRSGTEPYTGEIYIDNFQFSHAGEYRIVTYRYFSYYYVTDRVEQETFVITVNSEFNATL